MSSVGLFIIAVISITIQLLNTFPTDSRGLIQSTDLAVFNRMSYVTNKYLNGVGIYSAWPLDSDIKTDYIWLTDINQVVNHSLVDVLIQSDYNLNQKNYTLCFTQFQKSTCYSVLNGTMSKLIEDQSSITQFLSNSIVEYHISIVKEPALQFIYKIGYLDYNLNKFSTNGTSRNCAQVPYFSF